MPTETPYMKGRHRTGYLKRKIFGTEWGLWEFDCYLLRYPEGACIPPHTDKVFLKRHFRLNIVFKKAKEGGEFSAKGPLILNLPRIVFFRSDKVFHGVSAVIEGERRVLSFGIAAPI